MNIFKVLDIKIEEVEDTIQYKNVIWINFQIMKLIK